MRAGAGAGQEQDLSGGADELRQPGEVSREQLGELGAAVVDHLLGLRLADLARDRRGAGRAEVLFHAVAS